jgi:hypothetical protein
MKGLYQVLRGVVNPQALSIMKWATIVQRDVIHYNAKIPFNDEKFLSDDEVEGVAVGKNQLFYSTSVSEATLITLLPLIQSTVKKTLYPTYSFTRMYWKGSSLTRHTDRPSCEYSITLCVDIDPIPWGIYMGEREVILNPGDICIYKGCEIDHWRKPYEGNRVIQTFLHYVDASGPYANYKFDGRFILGLEQHQQENPFL